MLLLTLAGVPADVVADDYEISSTRLPAMYAARGGEPQGPHIDALFQKAGTTARDVILRTLSEIDVRSMLHTGGLDDAEAEAAAARLVPRV
jgi:hypothetical protein